MNRRIIGVLAAVLLAAVGTFVLVNYVRTAEERALAGEETVDVLVVRERIGEGTAAEDIGERVALERIPAKVLAEGGLDSLDDVEGRVARMDLLPGEQVASSRFVEPAVLEEQREIDVPEGMQLVTFPVDQTRSVGGQVRPGDTVGFIGSFSGFEEDDDDEDEADDDIADRIEELTGDTTGFVIHKALVTRVQTDAQAGGDGATPALGGGDDEDDEDEAAASDPRAVQDAPPGSFLVTVAVEAGDAERIVFTAEHGTIWLTLEPEDAVEDGASIQTLETIYQ